MPSRHPKSGHATPPGRLEAAFDAAHNGNRAALLAYILAGHPSPGLSERAVDRLRAGGVDILEFGLPSAAPFLDGPVITAAHEAARRQGVDSCDALALLSRIRRAHPDLPIVAMGYTDAIAASAAGVDGPRTNKPHGAAGFAERLAAAGADALLMVGADDALSATLAGACAGAGLASIATVGRPNDTPLSPPGAGFLYYRAGQGRSGGPMRAFATIETDLATWRRRSKLPVVAGFGIKQAADVARLSGSVDGVVVGSAVVDRVAALADDAEAGLAGIQTFAAALREATKRTDVA